MKKLLLTMLPIFALFLLAVMVVGCTASPKIVGKWQDTQSTDTIEFLKNGNIVVTSNGVADAGTYEIVSDNIVKVSFSGLAGGMISLFGGDTWNYTISGNTLSIQVMGSTLTLKRM